MPEFYGRDPEICTLRRLLNKQTASLAVIKGRRRIGKSKLVEKFAEKMLFYKFEGLAPQKNTTAQSQREQFSKQLQKYFEVPVKADDWWDLLWFLASKAKTGRVIILLDEISWMGDKDNDFLGKLKSVWDNHFKKNPKLILILCGSVSTWIDKNILSSTGFAGRISLEITLQELPLNICNEFWGRQKNRISSYEKFKILSVTGGIPRYLEEIDPRLSAEENIKNLCFDPSGILFRDFEQIFPDVLDSQSSAYKKIITFLAGTKFAEREVIAKKVNLELGGLVSEYLNDLEEIGFLSRDYTWHIKTGEISKLSNYRLRDNYLRFYLKYIYPQKQKIIKHIYKKQTLTSFPAWDTIMGLQFENLVLSNRENVFQMLDINHSDIVYDNPFFQRKTSRQNGCQIDYLIHTKFNTVYICEIKFSRFTITPKIIGEIDRKIKNLKLPKYFSYRPVLIHINGAREDLIDSGYFAYIIDFSDLLIIKN